MKNKIVSIASLILIGATTLAAFPACGVLPAVVPALVTIAKVIADAEDVLKIISSTTEQFNNNGLLSEDVYAKYADLKVKADKALSAAKTALSGLDKVTQEQYNAAIADFKVAYEELKDLLVKNGVKLDDKAAASPDSKAVDIREPLAVSYQVE